MHPPYLFMLDEFQSRIDRIYKKASPQDVMNGRPQVVGE
ncbi:hypothetical protein CES85_3466 (plasmid) [Ochrobactrum quorumnocens]|uniref:Uncharacterized protein n=1 Tax=Ochrobactrum quorumnocens TaxID=271865 RepID=A0A248UPV6_9HYPH|nr:hypothetical protein CES85_3466 [[Ochrobactrum] quorumnocens]